MILIYLSELFFIGEPNSHAFGSVMDGVFEGKIVSHTGAYYVEKAHRYFPKGMNDTFHSVIYRENDVHDPYESIRTGTCYMQLFTQIVNFFSRIK